MKQKLLYICLVIVAFAWNGKAAGQDNHLPFNPMTQEIYKKCEVATEGNSCKWDNGIYLKHGPFLDATGGFQWDDKYYIMQFIGIPGSLSFSYKAQAAATGVDWYIAISEDGNNFSNIWSSTNSSGTETVEIPNKKAKYIKFCYSGNLSGTFSDIVITEYFNFSADKSSLSFEEIYDDESTSLPIILSHCNAGNGVKVVSSDSHFTVTPEILTSTGGDRIGEETITVTYHNDELIMNNHSVTHTGTITITDDTPLGSNPQPFEPIVIEVTGVSVPSTLYLKPDKPSYEERTYKHAVLDRKLKAGYNTIALPFATNVEELTGNAEDWVAQLHTVTKSKADGYSLYFQKVDGGEIVANQPYVLYLNEAVETPKWENINSEIAQPTEMSIEPQTGYSGYKDWTMTSNFAPGFSMDGKYGIVNRDENSGWMKGHGESAILNAFAAYITPPAAEGGSSFRVRAAYIDPDGTTTFVDGLPVDGDWEWTGDGEPAAIYGPDGTQRAQLIPGVNIVRYGDGRTRKVYKN